MRYNGVEWGTTQGVRIIGISWGEVGVHKGEGSPEAQGDIPGGQGKIEKSGVTLRKSSPSEVEGNWVGGNSGASY